MASSDLPSPPQPPASEALPLLESDPDAIFAQPRPRISDFDFGAETARVFDDMLHRSVPSYAEIQRMTGLLAADFATPGSRIYDLGCSTGASFFAVAKHLPPEKQDVTFIGLDNSREMLARARKNLEERDFPHPYELVEADLNKPIHIENASVVLMVLTLQFLRPLHRDGLLRTIHEGLNERGCLILVEKVLGNNSDLNRLFIDYYYQFKRANGYTDLEIAQKREALENVLVPYRLDENFELLHRAGFSTVDVFFKWFNFCGLIATK